MSGPKKFLLVVYGSRQCITCSDKIWKYKYLSIEGVMIFNYHTCGSIYLSSITSIDLRMRYITQNYSRNQVDHHRNGAPR